MPKLQSITRHLPGLTPNRPRRQRGKRSAQIKLSPEALRYGLNGPFPDDVLRLIFLFCLDEAPPSQGSKLWLTTWRCVPLVFTLVSRQWRSVVLSCPPLWSSLSAVEERDAPRLRRALHSLKRSCLAPFKSAVEVRPRQGFEELVLAVNPSWDTWSRQDLRTLFTHLGTPITSLYLNEISVITLRKLPPGLFPALKDLALLVSDSVKEVWPNAQPTPAQSIQAIVAFSKCRRLTTITSISRACLILAGQGLFQLPWKTIDSLSEDPRGAPSGSLSYFLLHYMPLCRRLTRLDIRLGPEDGEYLFPGLSAQSLGPISLLRLSHLRLEICVAGSDGRMLDYDLLQWMKLPKLNDLTIYTGGQLRPPSGPQFAEGLRQAVKKHSVWSFGCDFRLTSDEDVVQVSHILDALGRPGTLWIDVLEESKAGYFQALSRYVEIAKSSGKQFPRARLARVNIVWKDGGGAQESMGIGEAEQSEGFEAFANACLQSRTPIQIGLLHPLDRESQAIKGLQGDFVRLGLESEVL